MSGTGQSFTVSVTGLFPAKTIAQVNEGESKLIINDTANPVYLSNYQDCSPLNGTSVIVKPYTSLNWVSPGRIFAIRDVGIVGNVVVTDSASDWSPSPVDIGVAVATQLIQTGVTVQERTSLVPYNTTVDSSTYNSVYGRLWNRLAFGNKVLHNISFLTVSSGQIGSLFVSQLTDDSIPISFALPSPRFSYVGTSFDAAGNLVAGPDPNDASLLFMTSRSTDHTVVGPGTVQDLAAVNPIAGNSTNMGILLAINALSIPAMTTRTWYIPAYFGKVSVRIGGGTGNATFQWSYAPNTSGIAFQFSRTSTTGDSNFETNMPSMQGTFSLANNTAGAQTYWVTMMKENQ